MTPEAVSDALVGRASLPYEDVDSPGRRVVLECYRPEAYRDGPVVIVQHGMGRNGDEYCDAWMPAADRHGLLIVAPTFPKSDWPGPACYNDGHVRAADGSVRSRSGWSNALPGRVLRLLRDASVTTRRRATLWGHSAGGQFVHRLLALQGADDFEAVGAANAGWYTWPTLDRPYPEGLGGIGLTEADLVRWLEYKLVVFAGDQDLGSENLPQGEAASAQGPTRFARAHAFLEAGRAAAAGLGVACGWSLVVVPGVGHEGMRMAAAAAGYWFDGALPTMEPGRAVGTEA